MKAIKSLLIVGSLLSSLYAGTIKVGNTYFHSDGSYSTTINGSTFNSDGSYSTTVGGSTLNSDGSSASRVGDSVVGSGSYYGY